MSQRGGRTKAKIDPDKVPSFDDLREVGKHLSFTERRADDAERELRQVKILELLSQREASMSRLLEPFRSTYFITGEINTPVADVALKLQELKERYAGEGRLSHLDGLSVDADDWHFNVRPSNTEPLLRLNLEATSEALMEQKRDEVLAVIRS